MRKAAIMSKNKSIREDDLINRLLFKFKKLFNIHANHVKVINDNVYLLHCGNEKMIIKRYKTKNHIKKQIWLARKFDAKSYRGSVKFKPFADGKYVKKVDNYYYALMHFIEGKPLSFSSRTDRIAAFKQLEKFQAEIRSLSERRPEYVPIYSLYSKWATRLDTFYFNLYNNKKYLTNAQYKMMKNFLKWGEYTLDTLPIDVLQRMERKARRSGLLVHGDVANHNFLKTNDGSIMMIDYDLMACAPPEYDTLQLINRYFPYCNYSLATIIQELGGSFVKLIKTKWFATALIYPTDIFREWNRLTTNYPINEKKLYSYISQLEKHYEKRVDIVNELRALCKDKNN
jgi:Ser/Thr protein kinase RdoA (MazF antagonist)